MRATGTTAWLAVVEAVSFPAGTPSIWSRPTAPAPTANTWRNCGEALPAAALALLNGMVDAYDRFIYGRIIGEPDWALFHQQIDEAGLAAALDEKRTTAQAKATP